MKMEPSPCLRNIYIALKTPRREKVSSVLRSGGITEAKYSYDAGILEKSPTCIQVISLGCEVMSLPGIFVHSVHFSCRTRWYDSLCETHT